MKLLFILGTRPEAIKMAPLILKFKEIFGSDIKVLATAQHRKMLDQVLDFFEINPDYDLNLMTPNQSLNNLSGKLFFAVDEVYNDCKPDWVFVHGDTTTSAICAWAAFHRSIKVAHVEAGLRTYNKYAPFPEEINRQITGRIADVHFAPTLNAKKNLLKEGADGKNIIVTGNTVIDALFLGISKLKSGYTDDEIEKLKIIRDTNKRLILVTGHRRENFGEGFIQICNALIEIATNYKDVQIIYPVHLNPNVQKPVYSLLSNYRNISLIEPLGYPAFLWLMQQAYLILTDSGGIQEEAPSLGIPVLVMREVTERPEAVETGVVKLVGTDKQRIVSEVSKLLENVEHYKQMSNRMNPYGDGKACERISMYFEALKK